MSALLQFDQELARLLTEAAREKQSGVLTATRGKLKRIFCLDQGDVVYAKSNVIEEQLDEFLARHEHLSPGDLAGAVTASRKQRGLSLCRLLLDKALLTEQQLRSLVETQVRELLYATIDWSDGAIKLVQGRPNLGDSITVRLPGNDLLLDYARTHPDSLEQVRIRIGPPDTALVRVENAEEQLGAAPLDDATRYALQQCVEGIEATRFVEESSAPADVSWRALYGLMLVGALVTTTEKAAWDKASADGVSRDEMQARLDLAASADYYTVLELNLTATQDEIREAYYFLARRYHPDRFRSSALADLREPIEQYFAKVTEAYNSLHDPESRQQYDEQRASESSRPQESEQDTTYLAKKNYAQARLLIGKGRFTDAATALENAIAQDGNQALYHVELGRLLARNPRRRKEAEEHLMQANQVDPTHTDGYLALGDLYVKTGRLEDAARLYREVLRWEPGHLDATDRLEALRKAAATGDGGILKGLFGN